MEGSIVYQRSNGGESSCIILKTGTIVPILKPYKTEKHEIQKGRLVSIHPPRYISCEMADGTKQRIQWGQVFARVAYASLLESNRIQDPEGISSDCAHHPLEANRSGELQARRATIGLKRKAEIEKLEQHEDWLVSVPDDSAGGSESAMQKLQVCSAKRNQNQWHGIVYQELPNLIPCDPQYFLIFLDQGTFSGCPLPRSFHSFV